MPGPALVFVGAFKCFEIVLFDVFPQRLSNEFQVFNVFHNRWNRLLGRIHFFSRWSRVSGRISFFSEAAIGYEGSLLLNFVSLLDLVFHFRSSAI